MRQPVRALMASAAILLLGSVALTFSMQVGTAATQTQVVTSVTFPQKKTPASPNGTAVSKPKVVSDPNATSVLDADMLNSPVSYLREAFSPEDEDDTEPFRSGTVMITLKALAASLLSTII